MRCALYNVCGVRCAVCGGWEVCVENTRGISCFQGIAAVPQQTWCTHFILCSSYRGLILPFVCLTHGFSVATKKKGWQTTQVGVPGATAGMMRTSGTALRMRRGLIYVHARTLVDLASTYIFVHTGLLSTILPSLFLFILDY